MQASRDWSETALSYLNAVKNLSTKKSKCPVQEHTACLTGFNSSNWNLEREIEVGALSLGSWSEARR